MLVWYCKERSEKWGRDVEQRRENTREGVVWCEMLDRCVCCLPLMCNQTKIVSVTAFFKKKHTYQTHNFIFLNTKISIWNTLPKHFSLYEYYKYVFLTTLFKPHFHIILNNITQTPLPNKPLVFTTCLWFEVRLKEKWVEVYTLAHITFNYWKI